MGFAFEMLAKSTLVLGLTFALLFMFRRASAGFRHSLISWSLFGLLCLPVLSIVVPDWQIPIIPAASETTPSAVIAKEIFQPASDEPPAGIAPAGITTSAEIPAGRTSGDLAPPAAAEWNVTLPRLLVYIWLTGLLVMLVKIGLEMWYLHQLKNQATAFPLTGGEKILQHTLPGVKAPVALQVLQHHRIVTPMTWNGLRPIILLPGAAAQWQREELEIILAHELAHIQRKDFYLHLFCLFMTAIYWFHPLIWVLKKRYLLEREKACDETVVSMGIKPVDYAERLLSVAGRLAAGHPSRAGLALQMAQPSMIKSRIISILQLQGYDKHRARVPKWVGMLCLFPVLPLLAVVNPASVPVLDHFPMPEATVLLPAPEVLLSAAAVEPAPGANFENSGSITLPSMPAVNARYFDPLDVLPRRIPELTVDHQPLSITLERSSFDRPVEEVPVRQRLYGEWQDGRRQFKVYLRGSFTILPVAPYLEAPSTKDMLVIEEHKAGRVTRLTIAKTPYDGALIQSFIGKRPNSWSDLAAGQPLYLWTINDQWVFLGKGRDKWMSAHLADIAEKLQNQQDPVWQSVKEADQLWKNRIESEETLLAERFVPKTSLPTWDQAVGKMGYDPAPPGPLFPLEALPLRASPPEPSAQYGKTKKIGSDAAVRTTTGWSGGNHRGARYATLIGAGREAGQLTAFYFHLRYNFCTNATLQLQLYEVVNGKPAFAMQAEPILIETGGHTGWIKKDLQDLQLTVSNDMLLVLEVVDYHPKDSESGGGLFFSHSRQGNGPIQEMMEGESWDFAAVPLAAYFDLE